MSCEVRFSLDSDAPEDFVTALEVLSVTDISPEVDGVRSIYL